MEEIRTILCRRLLFLCSIQEAVIGCKLRTAFSSQITWAVCRLPLCFPASSSPPLAWLNREPCAALLNRAEKKEKEMGLAKSYCTGRYRARAGSVCLAGRPGTQRKRTTAREPRVVVGCAHVTTRLFTRPSGLSNASRAAAAAAACPAFSSETTPPNPERVDPPKTICLPGSENRRSCFGSQISIMFHQLTCSCGLVSVFRTGYLQLNSWCHLACMVPRI